MHYINSFCICLSTSGDDALSKYTLVCGHRVGCVCVCVWGGGGARTPFMHIPHIHIMDVGYVLHRFEDFTQTCGIFHFST